MTPQEIADIFAEIELKLIAGLKEALKVGKTVDYSSFKLQTLRSMEAYRKRCSDIWIEYLPMIEEETAELLETAYVDGVRDVQLQHEQLFPDEDMDGELHQRFAGVNTRRMDSLIEDVNQNLHTAQTASLRMMDDVYREVVYKAEIHHATGGVTMPQAVDQAVKDFLERGINCIEYSNGRRVNIATYAEMALRTASLRSKLRGEAAKRLEFGVDTVLVSQYGACSDTCLPWQGRVYIDDVWGDNTNIWVVDGRGQSLNGQWYPLLSEAVEGGLFHPNCRHGVTTWYEGASRMPTPLDATAVRERSRLEQRQRELERKVRKWKRLEEGSQTPEAIAKYKRRRLDAQKTLREFIREHDDVLRRDYWREKVYDIKSGKTIEEATFEKGAISYNHLVRFGNNTVDLDYIRSSAYRSKYTRLTHNSLVNDRIRSFASAALTKHNGTDTESLLIIDAETGETVFKKTGRKNALGIALSDDEIWKIRLYPGKKIGIHNHPSNLYPTGSDFSAAGSRGYDFGLIVTHDGKVYKYSVGNIPFEKTVVDGRVDKFTRNVYTELEKRKQYQKALDELSKEYGIVWEEL